MGYVSYVVIDERDDNILSECDTLEEAKQCAEEYINNGYCTDEVYIERREIVARPRSAITVTWEE